MSPEATAHLAQVVASLQPRLEFPERVAQLALGVYRSPWGQQDCHFAATGVIYEGMVERHHWEASGATELDIGQRRFPAANIFERYPDVKSLGNWIRLNFTPTSVSDLGSLRSSRRILPRLNPGRLHDNAHVRPLVTPAQVAAYAVVHNTELAKDVASLALTEYLELGRRVRFHNPKASIRFLSTIYAYLVSARYLGNEASHAVLSHASSEPLPVLLSSQPTISWRAVDDRYRRTAGALLRIKPRPRALLLLNHVDGWPAGRLATQFGATEQEVDATLDATVDLARKFYLAA